MQKVIAEHVMSMVEITLCIWDIERKQKAFKIVAQVKQITDVYYSTYVLWNTEQYD
jgi:hypothetical protein